MARGSSARAPGVWRHRSQGGQEGGRQNGFTSFSVFVDGLSDGVSRAKVGAIFSKAGVLRSVYVQNRKRVGRRLRFGFLRFSSNGEAECAIRMFNGLKLDGAFLTVKRAKYQSWGSGLSAVPQGEMKHQFGVRGKYWRPKRTQTDMVAIPRKEEVSSAMLYSSSHEDKEWIDRCAWGTLYNVISLETVQEGFRMQGLTNFKLKLLGARDVLLEFESKEELNFTLSEASGVLDIFLEWYKPCSISTTGQAFLTWLRVWKVPLGAWNSDFFSSIANVLGKFVCVDSITSRKERMDFARVLVETTSPLFEQQFMDVKVDDTEYRVLIEKELSVYQDWSSLKLIPKAKHDSSDEEDGDVEKETEANIETSEREDREVTTAMEAVSKRGVVTHDFGGATVTFQDLMEAGYSAGDVLNWLKRAATQGVKGCNEVEVTKENAEVGEKIQEKRFANDDMIIEGKKVNYEMSTGACGEMSRESRPSNAIVMCEDFHQVMCDPQCDIIQSRVGGDKVGAARDIKEHQTRVGWILKNPLIGFRGSLRQLKVLARSIHREGFIRELGLYDSGPPASKVVPETGLGAGLKDGSAPVMNGEILRENDENSRWENDKYADIEENFERKQNHKKGRKNGGAAGTKRVGKTGARRGRPLGSKNKQKKMSVIEAVCSGDEVDADDVESWARSVWRVGKEVGVVFKGDEDLLMQRLQDQVRANHPDLQ